MELLFTFQENILLDNSIIKKSMCFLPMMVSCELSDRNGKDTEETEYLKM